MFRFHQSITLNKNISGFLDRIIGAVSPTPQPIPIRVTCDSPAQHAVNLRFNDRP